MDNRLRFLYYDIRELWGHVWKVQPGNGKTRVSEVPDIKEKPYVNGKA